PVPRIVLGTATFWCAFALTEPSEMAADLRRRIPTRSPCGSRVTEFVDLTGDRAASSQTVGMGSCDAHACQGGSYRLSGTPFVALSCPTTRFAIAQVSMWLCPWKNSRQVTTVAMTGFALRIFAKVF